MSFVTCHLSFFVFCVRFAKSGLQCYKEYILYILIYIIYILYPLNPLVFAQVTSDK